MNTNAVNTNAVNANSFPNHLASTGPRETGRRVGLVIKVNETKNPKKRDAAVRFSKYRNGMSPAEYADAIGGNRDQAFRDLVWDSEHGYIDLVMNGIVKQG